LKTLHKFILKSFAGPFVMTFFIAIFVLLMQSLWLYVDDLIGKGLEWYVILELLGYASASLVPLALPLAILLSSIMTFGNMGEHYELVAMKSAGLSLQRIMKPLIFLALGICMVAFYFANNLLPVANLKFRTLLYDITHQKPAIDIREGIFYNGIDGYSIRIGRKENNGTLLKNIMIYDHTARTGSNKIIVAESGIMKFSDDNSFMILDLENGFSYDEQAAQNRDKQNFPLLRNKFSRQLIRMDLTGFSLSRSDEDIFKDNYQMLSMSQLSSAIAEMEQQNIDKHQEYAEYLSENYYRNRPKTDTLFNDAGEEELVIARPLLLKDFSREDQLKAIETASNLVRTAKAYSEAFAGDVENRNRYINKHLVEWHKKIALSFACMILFFIGAPLGAIIRKGGLGMPVVVSFIFFILFHIISISGEKMVKEGVIEPFFGMWLASLIFLPIGIFLTYKATRDSAIFDMDFYQAAFNFLKKKKNTTAA
jgi:lipopolysaccharide export system permease protein